MQRLSSAIALLLLFACPAAFSEEPALPAGLIDASEPMLPTGLNNEPELPSGLGTLPELPSGLSSNPESEENWQSDESPAWQTDGFLEARFGQWRKSRNVLTRHPVAETRLQLTTERAFNSFSVNISADLLYDDSATEQRPKLETGQGWLDLRSANIVFSPLSMVDIRLGRQILTWGTGDLIFINDLFPKDWNSFLIGRDDAYLKAPSDALKLSLFSDSANLDLVYTPRFDADRYIDGERAAYYNANLGRIAGTDAVISVEKPHSWFSDDEIALRLYRNLATFEIALYGYDGFWKSPAGADPNSGNALFPRLSVYGASLRGPLLGGIVNGEWGYYDSKDDASGRNPLINNSEQRLLLGYEHELIANLTLAMQLYSTRMLDYGTYRQSLPGALPAARQNRHEIGARVTWLALDQKLTASLFLRYSTSDRDYYLRPKLHYSVDDHWSYELGANIFHGNQAYTFFGQFQHNDNIYVALRYGL
ncbi:MAG: hypothetical protein GXP10_11120 [Gammaproteobacteria bacterium]|nr:hypothetical protein [Gammaproteobacteria bacterium]